MVSVDVTCALTEITLQSDHLLKQAARPRGVVVFDRYLNVRAPLRLFPPLLD